MGFLARLEARLQQAARFPLSGSPRFHLGDQLRALFFESYILYYLPSAEEIIVVRVLHGARDMRSIAEEGGFAF